MSWMQVKNVKTGEVFVAREQDRVKLGKDEKVECWESTPEKCQFFDNGKVQGFVCRRGDLPKPRIFLGAFLMEVKCWF